MGKQKILFVTGKGGVGKSAVALSLAKKYAQKGKVLLVELGVRSYFADYLKLSITYQPTTYLKNLDIAIWSGSECLKEYALHLLKIESLYRLFFENKVSRALIDVAPGLSELSILGKITSGIRAVGPPLDYDTIIVDSYATGHMLALLRAPRGMAQAVKIGPMFEQTKSMTEVLKNPEHTQFIIVTLPEELPVIEANELAYSIQQEVGLKSQIICNKIWQIDPNFYKLKDKKSENDSIESNFIRTISDLISHQKAWVQYLKHRHPEAKELPMVFSSSADEITNEIEGCL